MIVELFIPQLNQMIEFDFMKMKFDTDNHFIDGNQVISFQLRPNYSKNDTLMLGIHFTTDEIAIDERFPDYRFTTIEYLAKIELYDFNIEFVLQNNTLINNIIRAAKTMLPREYRLIKKTA